MTYSQSSRISRRAFLQLTATGGAAIVAAPHVILGASTPETLVVRQLGRTGFQVTTLGLGGQASLQWTPEGERPVDIISKAIRLGVNYVDTSNAYAQSQSHFGRAFRELGLTPGRPNYDDRKRRSLFVASKTCIRSGRGRYPETQNWTNGPRNSTAVDDLKRSMTQLWGDGSGSYPDGAYIDLFQVHALARAQEVDAIYEGLSDPDPDAERIGVLVTLLDFREGTNRTGLNPGHERLIRHIGITGHSSSPILMDALQRDDQGIIDTVLTVANANDRRYFSHQHNVIPVAAAKSVGVVSMKVFADGAFYEKPARWTRGPHEVVTRVGSPELPSAPLVQYPLSVDGVCLNIIGIGHTDSDPQRCQLEQNLSASQLTEPLASSRMRGIEQMAEQAKGGQTNYFQNAKRPLGPPRNVNLSLQTLNAARIVRLNWDTAFAADQRIVEYGVRRDGRTVGRVPHTPQTSKKPFVFEDRIEDRAAHRYTVVTTDAGGSTAAGPEQVLEARG